MPSTTRKRLDAEQVRQFLASQRPQTPPPLSPELERAITDAAGRARSGWSHVGQRYGEMFDRVFTPPAIVTRTADRIADAIDSPSTSRSPWQARLEGFGAGAVQGAASLLTPGDATLTLAGSRFASPLLRWLRPAAGAATIVRGVERATTGDSASDVAAGVGQAAMGGLMALPGFGALSRSRGTSGAARLDPIRVPGRSDRFREFEITGTPRQLERAYGPDRPTTPRIPYQSPSGVDGRGDVEAFPAGFDRYAPNISSHTSTPARPLVPAHTRALSEGEEAGIAALDDLLTRTHGESGTLGGNGTYHESAAGRPLGFLRPRLRISGEGPATDAELNVLLREAEKGRGDFTHDLADAGEKASASRLHRELAILDSEYGRRLLDERGGVSGDALADLAAYGGGALAGGTAGAASDEDSPARGFVLGAFAGAGAGHALRHGGSGLTGLARLRRFSMLSSPLTHARVGLGNVGSMGIEGVERALSGDVAGGRRILGTLTSPTAWRDAAAAARETYRSPVFAERASTGHDAPSTGVLSVPERALIANDAAFKRLAERAGLSTDDAARLTFSDEPTTASGRGVVNAGRTPLGQFMLPFAKTGVRMAERGAEYFQWLPKLLRGEGLTRADVAKGVLGAGAIGAGYAGDLDDPYSIAAAGPLALPVAAGGLLRRDDANESWTRAGERTLRGLGRFIPGLGPVQGNPAENFVGSFAPNAGRDVAEVLDPVDERQTPGWTGQAASKIPILRETLPRARQARRPRRALRPGR